jgi:hypothetical protein
MLRPIVDTPGASKTFGQRRLTGREALMRPLLCLLLASVAGCTPAKRWQQCDLADIACLDEAIRHWCGGGFACQDEEWEKVRTRQRTAGVDLIPSAAPWTGRDTATMRAMTADLHRLENAQLAFYAVNGVFTTSAFRLQPHLRDPLSTDRYLVTMRFVDEFLQHVEIGLRLLGEPVLCKINVIAGATRYLVECVKSP